MILLRCGTVLNPKKLLNCDELQELIYHDFFGYIGGHHNNTIHVGFYSHLVLNLYSSSEADLG